MDLSQLMFDENYLDDFEHQQQINQKSVKKKRTRRKEENKTVEMYLQKMSQGVINEYVCKKSPVPIQQRPIRLVPIIVKKSLICSDPDFRELTLPESAEAHSKKNYLAVLDFLIHWETHL